MAARAPKVIHRVVTQPPADRPAQQFEFSDSGGSVSCAFGRKGFRSSVWNVAVNAKGDVYVNERMVAAELKTSLHASGQWQHGFVRDDRTEQLTASGREFQAATGSRVFDLHGRPEVGGSGAAGVTTALTVFVTHEDVQAWPNDDVRRDEIVWSDAPAPGQAGLFQVLLTTPADLALTEFVGITGMVGVIGTRTGEIAVVTSQLVVMDDAEQVVAAEFRSAFRERYTVDEVANLRLGPGEFIRAQVIAPTSQGHREIWDLAMPPGV